MNLIIGGLTVFSASPWDSAIYTTHTTNAVFEVVAATASSGVTVKGTGSVIVKSADVIIVK